MKEVAPGSPSWMSGRVFWIGFAVLIGVVAAAAPNLIRHTPLHRQTATPIGPAVGMPGAPPTTASGLQERIDDMERRLRERPGDVSAAVLLADALLREARSTTDGRPANRASEVLKAVLTEDPTQYDALRMLGAIDLSQHRFRDALNVANRAHDLRPTDAWNYGVMGDALIELGEYEKAYEAFDTMMNLRPSSAAYARVSYARELRGDLQGALQAMDLAEKSTPPQDPESQAWYATHIGELYLKLGRLEEANRAYRQAIFVFANYPLAVIGQGKVKVARGDRDGALALYLDQVKRTPTLDLASRIGDLYAEAGKANESEHYYQLAEDLAGPPVAQTEANLALFLANHNRKLPEAVKIAEAVAATRQDIFTEDALAWAYFKIGRIDEAKTASARALRTGTRDEQLLSRGAQIRAASPSHARSGT
jgi:tetratricopeptide (TPR) repeat protein